MQHPLRDRRQLRYLAARFFQLGLTIPHNTNASTKGTFQLRLETHNLFGCATGRERGPGAAIVLCAAPRATRSARKRASRAVQVEMRHPMRGYQAGDRRGRLAQRPEKPSGIGHRRGFRPSETRPGSSLLLGKVNYISERRASRRSPTP